LGEGKNMYIKIQYQQKKYGSGQQIKAWTLDLRGDSNIKTSNTHSAPIPPRSITIKMTPGMHVPGIARARSKHAPDSQLEYAELTLNKQECEVLAKALATFVNQVDLVGNKAELSVEISAN